MAYDNRVILGVELEVEIKNDPDINTMFVSKSPVYSSANKVDPDNYTHPQHGVMVKLIEDLCREEIIVAYDATLEDGFELIGKPHSLSKNKEIWGTLLKNPKIAPYIHAGENGSYRRNGQQLHVGMHIHLSGDPITPLVLGKMMFFINKLDNTRLIEYIAGRPANAYCRPQPTLPSHAARLYHGKTCNKRGKIKWMDGNLDIYRTGMRYRADGSVDFCCLNAASYAATFNPGLRGAIYTTPGRNTGECEIRIFRSAVNLERFMTNLEFCVALVDFCHQAKLTELSVDSFSLWMNSLTCRLKYRNLFKYMRNGGFTMGLIPSRESLNNLIRRGKLPELIKAMSSVA